MARILAVDWDSLEIRFLLGNVVRDRVTILKAGSAPIRDAGATLAVREEGGEKSPEGEGEEANGERQAVASTESEGDSTNPPESKGEVETGSMPDSVTSNLPDEESEDSEAGKGGKHSGKRTAKDQKSFELGRRIRRVLHENGVRGGRLIFVLSRDHVEILNLVVPKMPENDLPDIVKNQVLRDSTTFNEGFPLDFLPLKSGEQFEGQKILSASISRIDLRHLKTTGSALGGKMSRLELRLTALSEFVRAGLIEISDPTLLVQEASDEISFALFDHGEPAYLRSVRIQSELSDSDRTERLKKEITRTLMIGSEGEPVQKVLLFGGPDDYGRLTEDLTAQGIDVQKVDPFRLPGVGVTARTLPENPGRFAPLVGGLLAEIPKGKPVLDLLHPRQKPKPPNYSLYFILFFIALGVGLGFLWRWNKKDLAAKLAELQSLQSKAAALQAEYQSLNPQFTILNNASRWNQFGVNVLDELRDITERIPTAPELAVSRLAYDGLDARFGMPVFIINAKISDPTVYQKFYNALTSDGSHGVNSRGVQRSATISDQEKSKASYDYTFTAVILCRPRPAADYLKALPAEEREISGNKPEFYDLQMDALSSPNGPAGGSQSGPSRPSGNPRNGTSGPTENPQNGASGPTENPQNGASGNPQNGSSGPADNSQGGTEPPNPNP